MSESLNDLPFDLKDFASDRPPLKFGKHNIPALGSATVGETIQYSEARDKFLKEPEEKRDYLSFKLGIVAMFLTSRLGQKVDPEKLKKIPLAAIDQADSFFYSELRMWEPLKEEVVEEAAKKLKAQLEQAKSNTGQASSGSSEDITQKRPDSVNGGLQAAQPT